MRYRYKYTIPLLSLVLLSTPSAVCSSVVVGFTSFSFNWTIDHQLYKEEEPTDIIMEILSSGYVYHGEISISNEM